MNTINEICLAWFMWVNSNLDILIMTITLIVVAGLVLEVVRLNKRIKATEERADWNVRDLNVKIWNLESEDEETFRQLCVAKQQLERNIEDQVQVNVHLAEDIVELQKKLKTKKK